MPTLIRRSALAAAALIAVAWLATSGDPAALPEPTRLADAEPPLGDFPGARTERIPERSPESVAPVERRRAAAIASRALTGRARVVLVRRDADDACGGCLIATAYDYDHDQVVTVAIDPGSWTMLGVTRGTGQPPLAGPERREAHALAERDPAARARLDGDPHVHPALASPMWPDHGPCATHRCATVLFMLDDYARTGVGRQMHVLVDLSARAVLDRIVLRCEPECRLGWGRR